MAQVRNKKVPFEISLISDRGRLLLIFMHNDFIDSSDVTSLRNALMMIVVVVSVVSVDLVVAALLCVVSGRSSGSSVEGDPVSGRLVANRQLRLGLRHHLLFPHDLENEFTL